FALPPLRSVRGPGLVVALVLAAIVVVGFVMRLIHIGNGLPYVYNYDEANHFTNHSVNFFTDDFDPGYYQNPSGLTELIYVVLRVQYGLLGALFHLPHGTAARRFALDKGTPLVRRADLHGFVLACLAMAFVFFLSTPYFFVHPHTAAYQLKQQAVAAGDTVKVGQEQQGGFAYYFESFGWGFGWAPLVAALAGVVFQWRRDRYRTLLLVAFPVVMFLYLGTQ